MHIEHLGRPCRTWNILAGRVVVDPAGNEEQFVLTNNNENGMELIFIDPARNTARIVKAPAGSGAWALAKVSGHRLVVGTFYDGTFMVFDLKTMSFIKTAAFFGEGYLWNFALGGDGRVYGGTYGGGRLGALDLDTYTVEDCGAPAAPNMYLRYVSATPEGDLLCRFMFDRPTVLRYDPKTKEFGPVPDSLQSIELGVAWNGYFLAGTRAWKGKGLDEVTPVPFPIPEKEGKWEVDTYLTDEKVLYLRQGHAIYRYESGDPGLTRVAEVDLRGGQVYAVNGKGELLGVRGQDYFVLRPEESVLRLRRIPGSCAGRPVHFIKTDPKGRLWGGPPFGQTLFCLDPATKAVENTGTVCDAMGEVYDVAFAGDAVYAAAYAGGNIIRYHPDRPWDQYGGTNPVTIAGLKDRGYIRPTGGICKGPKGKLYSGWMASYGIYGGAIAVTDTETGETDLIENPLGPMAVSGLASDGRLLYVGSSRFANGMPEQKDTAPSFGILDPETRTAIFQQSFPNARQVGGIHFDEATGRVVVVIDGTLSFFDPRVRAFLDNWVPDVPSVNGPSVAVRDGHLFYGSGRAVIDVDLVRRTVSRPVAEAAADVGCVAAGPDGRVYWMCNADTYLLHR
jgi:streptogramin lyase